MKHFLAMCLTVVFSATNATAFDFSSYSSDFNANDYREALNMGLKFYGGQRCGNTNNWMLINNPNVNRKYCHTKDGKGSVNNGGNGNYDLTGGWHDHGDHIKVATTMGYSALSLLIAYDLWPEAFQDNYDEAYGSGNDIPDVLDEVKIATDYFIKSFLDNGSFVYYVGFEGDHDVWVTSSKQSTLSVQKGGDPRPVWTTSEKGGPQAANYASALALMAMHYPDDTYNRLCTEYAKKAYEFAKMNKSAQASIPIFYSNPDPEWSDELSLAAILMYILTEDTSYKSEAFNYMAGKSASNNPLGWDNVADYAYYYLAKTDPAASNGLGETFADLLCKNVYSLHLNAGSLNPNGFPYYSNNWATNNLALGGAAAAALYSKLVEDGVITTSEDVSLADKFTQRIVDYILGNNEFNHTFLHGYKGDMTFRIRHRNAMGLNDNPSTDVKNTTDFMFASGAVIGGPSSTGVFNNIVEGGASYTETDCGCDYNAPFIVAIAGIVAKKDPDVAYIDADGKSQTLSSGKYETISSQIEFTNGWYVLSNSVELSGRITVSGTVHLILKDGCTLTVPMGIHLREGNSLTIYGQKNGTGKLTAGPCDQYLAGIGGNNHQGAGTLIVNGGNVEATAGYSAAGIGGGAQGYWAGHYGHGGTVVINGGTVYAKGNQYGAGIGGGGCHSYNVTAIPGEGGSVTINGGNVTAIGGDSGGYGIGPGRSSGNEGGPGTLSLGWRDKTDRIYMSSVKATVTLNSDFVYEDTKEAVTTGSLDGRAIIPPGSSETNDVSPSNPTNLTDLIVNPGFDGRNYDGWQGTGFGASGDVDDVAEHFNKTFDTYQEISGLPAGVYVVRVNGFYRAGNSPSDDYNAYKSGQDSNARLYIQGETLGEFSTPVKHLTASGRTEALGLPPGDVQTELELVVEDGSIWFPNTMVGANAYFHLPDEPNLYKSEIAGAIGDGDVLRLGVKKSVGIGDDWAVFDDFELLYYGNSVEAYQVIINSMLATNEVNLEGEGVFYGKQEYEAYQQVRTDLENSTSIEQIQENLPKLEQTREALSNSVSAYAQYISVIDEIYEWVIKAVGLSGDDLNVLADYLQKDANGEDYPKGNLRYILPTYEEGNGYGLLSIDEIQTEIDYLYGLRENAIRTSMYVGQDLTEMIKNPNFDLVDASGWLTDPQYNGGRITNWHGGNSQNYCAECYSHNFDIYQVIEGIQDGLYEVSVHAFYRTADNAAADNAFNMGSEEAKVLTEVYLNEFSKPVKNVFEIKYDENMANNCYATSDGHYTLNGMASATTAFSLEDELLNFTQKVYGLVTDGKLRLGIRNTTGTLYARWTLFDNFKLIYWAKNLNAVTSVIENYSERADELATSNFGRPEATALTNAVNAANNAQGPDAKYDALMALVDAYNKANESMDAYKQLDEALGRLNEALNDAAINNPTSKAYNDAAGYYDDMEEAYRNQTLSADDALEALQTINEWISKLRIPDYEDASDSNPIDMTMALVNPSFDIVNDFTGWSGTSFGTGGDEAANGEHYQENFDSYQVVYGLPAGTYAVTVKGMYRHGSPQEDYKALKAAQAAQAENPNYVDPTRLAFLYAQTPSSSASQPVDHTCEGGKATPDFSGTNAGTSSDPCYVADSRTSADLYFHDNENPDAYLTTVIIELKEGEPLRIGVKKEGDIPAYSWAIFDDFKLTYYGTDSYLNPSRKKGDVNQDGGVDISDIVATVNQIAGTSTYRFADVNQDGSVDISDIVAIINIIAGN